jgi:16S rRNA processing protein RimM
VNAGRHDSASALSGGSGEVRIPSGPRFLAVGRVRRPHGVRGELRVEVHTDHPERFALYKRLYLGPAGPGGEMAASAVSMVLQSHRFHGGTVLLKLEGVDDRTQAEAYRELWVWIAAEEAAPLQEGEVYLHQMLHLWAVEEGGEELGEVVEIIESSAHPVYVIRGPCGEVLVPDIDEVILQVDVAAGRMVVRLPAGLRE